MWSSRTEGVKPISLSEKKVVSCKYISVAEEKCSARLGWLKNSADKGGNEGEALGTVSLLVSGSQWSIHHFKLLLTTHIFNGGLLPGIVCDPHYKYPLLLPSSRIYNLFFNTPVDMGHVCMHVYMCAYGCTRFPLELTAPNLWQVTWLEEGMAIQMSFHRVLSPPLLYTLHVSSLLLVTDTQDSLWCPVTKDLSGSWQLRIKRCEAIAW